VGWNTNATRYGKALAPMPASAYARARVGERLVDGWVWIGYLVAVVAAEILVSLWSPQLGMGLHLALVFALTLHASFAPRRQRPLLLALLFAPLVRVTSLALPLAHLPMVYWYLLTSLPLFVAVVPAVRILGLSRQQLGICVGNLPLQLAIGLVGLPFGIAEYVVLQPAPLIAELSWQAMLLPMLILLVSSAFLEELIFRGVLQTAAGRVLGRWGLLYSSAVFAALYIGYLSVVSVALVFVVGLAFAWLVARTGSLLGVTLAHWLTNVGLHLVIPLLAA
jgi:membrane protease YdiL (CAAX protease family)